MTGINDIIMQVLDETEAAHGEDFAEHIPQAAQIIMQNDEMAKRIMHYCLQHSALLERGFQPRKLVYIGQDAQGISFSFRTRHKEPLAIRLLPREEAAMHSAPTAVGKDFPIPADTGEVLCVRIDQLSDEEKKKRKTHGSRGKTLAQYKAQLAQYRLEKGHSIREKIFSETPIKTPDAPPHDR